MIETTVFDSGHMPANSQKEAVMDFLFEHLGAYGDPRPDIEKAIDYALSPLSQAGGFVITAFQQDTLVGAAVVNKTGMKSYIPENILVYIATHGAYRGQGIGKQLMRQIIDRAEGDIALHVEPDNPAKALYEQYGFTNKYLEMRLKQNSN